MNGGSCYCIALGSGSVRDGFGSALITEWESTDYSQGPGGGQQMVDY